jgi:Sulfatase-modifying factor enzyme 1
MDQSSTNEKELLALVFDASSSAEPYLSEIWEATKAIESILGVEELELFMLGNGTSVSPSTLSQSRPPTVSHQRRPCSLLAPIMETLMRERKRFSVVIVGNGEIFDLDDWADESLMDGLLLVQAGPDSLKKPTTYVNEINIEELDTQSDNLHELFSRSKHAADESTKTSAKPDDHKWRVDSTGYPLIFVKTLGIYAQLFPVTNPQFEKFIATRRQSEFDDEWYNHLLSMRTRESYRDEDVNLANLFITGITTDEAKSFCRWLGRDYRLLTAEEWRACHSWFESQPPPSLTADLSALLSRDAMEIWAQIERNKFHQYPDMKLQDLSMMKQGILEWVAEMPGKYHGIGDPVAVKSLRNVYDPVDPLGTEPRLGNLGFRVCMR